MIMFPQAKDIIEKMSDGKNNELLSRVESN